MMVDLRGKPCLVVGGGSVAARKVALLVECGAKVEVVSPRVTPRLASQATDGRIRLRRRAVRPGDVTGAFLVVAATDDPQVNGRVAELARRAGAHVNVADDPAACSFIVPSVIRRGDLTIAISTGGGSPALAKRLRQRLEQTIGPEYAAFLAAMRRLRDRAQQTIADAAERRAIYRRAVESDLFDLVASGDPAAVATRIDDLLQVPAKVGAGQ
jgi:precorrin-2 dehydrogenase/sirohydrochlorin ferrochelatase